MYNNSIKVFEDEIFSQPDSLKSTVKFIRENFNPNFEKNKILNNDVYFVGSGDSLIACFGLLEIIDSEFKNIKFVTPYELLLDKFSKNDTFIFISFSGENKQLVQIANKVLCKSNISISITFNSHNTLSKVCKYNIKIPIKSNRKTPHAVDYINTMIAVAILVEKLKLKEYEDINSLHNIIQKQLDTSREDCLKYKYYKSTNKYFLLGNGQSNSSCNYGSAKLWEVGGIQSYFSKIDEFPHGMHFIADKSNDCILLLLNDIRLKKYYKILVETYNSFTQNLIVISKFNEFECINYFKMIDIDSKFNSFLETIILQCFCLQICKTHDYNVTEKNSIIKDIDHYQKFHNKFVR